MKIIYRGETMNIQAIEKGILSLTILFAELKDLEKLRYQTKSEFKSMKLRGQQNRIKIKTQSILKGLNENLK